MLSDAALLQLWLCLKPPVWCEIDAFQTFEPAHPQVSMRLPGIRAIHGEPGNLAQVFGMYLDKFQGLSQFLTSGTCDLFE